MGAIQSYGEEDFMTSLIQSNKVAFFLLVLVIVSLLTVLAFAIVTNGASLELLDASMMRYCEGSGAVCTGV
jgi:hypothetical protein